MGVPSFFRWIARHFPKILVDCIEEYPTLVNGEEVLPDTSKPNPNGEYDCLYLDMNGIIHPCSHPEGKDQPTEDEIMIAIMNYIDRLFTIVRPRRLLYMAIDGVAPRAKMNQQRSRRFRAAKEARESAEMEDGIVDDLVANGLMNPEDVPTHSRWDSNQITPGTPFMKRVAECLTYYVADRITNDPGWRNISVVISDASVPGEGEHKIMEYIRHQRVQVGYNPNTRHCVYGLDADLIMLAIATHEPYFTLLREDVVVRDKIKFRPGDSVNKEDVYKHEPFQFLLINALREYLAVKLKPEKEDFKYDLERALDDFVFICFFAGNDFLPHVPTLDIKEDAVELLMKVYRETLGETGYLTDNGHVAFDRVAKLIEKIIPLEDELVAKHQAKEAMMIKQRQRSRQRSYSEPPRHNPFFDNTGEIKTAKQKIEDEKKKAKDDLSYKRENLVLNDDINFEKEGWRERYYKSKFSVDMDNEEFFKKITQSYAEGLQWVMYYYYQGCCSWEWYYPFHYSPFTKELKQIENVELKFNKSKPFRPFDQLLSVLPSASAQFLPEAYAKLMKDPNSPIIDFYPDDFGVDPNGKALAWLGVALLPFIDEKRLFEAMKGLESTLTPEEIERNSLGNDYIFVHKNHPIADAIRTSIELESNSKESRAKIENPNATIFGYVTNRNLPKSLPSPTTLLPNLENYQIYCAIFDLPDKPKHEGTYIFESKLLPGLIEPPRILDERELQFAAQRDFKIGHEGNRMIQNSGLPRSRSYSDRSHHSDSHYDRRSSGGRGRGGWGGQDNYRAQNNYRGQDNYREQNNYRGQDNYREQNNYRGQDNYDRRGGQGGWRGQDNFDGQREGRGGQGGWGGQPNWGGQQEQNTYVPKPIQDNYSEQTGGQGGWSGQPNWGGQQEQNTYVPKPIQDFQNLGVILNPQEGFDEPPRYNNGYGDRQNNQGNRGYNQQGGRGYNQQVYNQNRQQGGRGYNQGYNNNQGGRGYNQQGFNNNQGGYNQGGFGGRQNQGRGRHQGGRHNQQGGHNDQFDRQNKAYDPYSSFTEKGGLPRGQKRQRDEEDPSDLPPTKSRKTM